jgi:hypothetical protein
LALEQDPAVNRRLRIVCPSGSTNADVQLIFRNAQGATLESRQSSVSAGGTADSMVPQGSGEQRAASVEVRSTVPISARLEVSGGKDPWSIDGRPASSAIASRLLQPHAEWNGIFNSRLLMINTSANPVSVTLRLFQRDGTAVGTGIQRSIAGNGTLSETVEAIFAIARGTPAGSGWITLETPGGEVNCSVLVVDALGGAAAASPMVPVGGSSWSLPFYVENVGYYTGLALLNPNDTALSMTLTAYKGDGTVQARMQSTLGPRESRVQLVSQWLTQLPAESTGHIVITGTGALSLLSYFGTDDGAALAAIPLVTNSP